MTLCHIWHKERTEAGLQHLKCISKLLYTHMCAKMNVSSHVICDVKLRVTVEISANLQCNDRTWGVNWLTEYVNLTFPDAPVLAEVQDQYMHYFYYRLLAADANSMVISQDRHQSWLPAYWHHIWIASLFVTATDFEVSCYLAKTIVGVAAACKSAREMQGSTSDMVVHSKTFFQIIVSHWLVAGHTSQHSKKLEKLILVRLKENFQLA